MIEECTELTAAIRWSHCSKYEILYIEKKKKVNAMTFFVFCVLEILFGFFLNCYRVC